MCTRKEVNDIVIKENNKLEIRLLEKLHPMIIESIQANALHLEASPKTQKALGLIRDNCTKMTNQFHLNQKMIQKDIQQIQKDLSKYIKADTKWKEDLEGDLKNDYAEKWVEKALTRLNWMVIIAVVGAIIALVVKS